MKYLKHFLLIAGGLLVAANTVLAVSTDAMLDGCADVAKSYYKEYQARTKMKYNGQRSDGTHAINGEIFLENRPGRFACSYDRHGRKMIEFYADGETRNDYLPGGGKHHSRDDDHGKHHGRDDDHGKHHSRDDDYGKHHSRDDDSGNYFVVTGVPGNEILNVRSGPSSRGRIVGALGNGDKVRNLGCENKEGSRWCRIQMLDEMRSEGWVNARYLRTSGGSSQSNAHVNHGSWIDNLCAKAVAERVGVDVDDVIVTNSTVSEGTGKHVVYVGVPYGKADWICETDRRGNFVNVFYSGE